MSNVSYITHNGKKVLYIDYTKSKNIDDTLAVLDEVKAEFYKTSGVWLTINDFRGGYGSTEYMKKASQYAREHFNSRPSKNTAIGVTGLKKVLLQAYNTVVKDPVVPFDTLEEALNYLTK
ncbi:MAG TPA: hypothetical protein PKH79_11975 [Prolixibacteraceae bacterium]|nr:hypothetical protein [Prolixibacteraceae bacterium]